MFETGSFITFVIALGIGIVFATLLSWALDIPEHKWIWQVLRQYKKKQ